MRLCIFLLVLFGASLLSCKKSLKCDQVDPITGEKSILVGGWKYKYTVRYFLNSSTGTTTVDTIYDENNEYNINLLEEGKFEFESNGKIENHWCIIFDGFNGNSNTIKTTLLLSNESEQDHWCHIRYNKSGNYFNVQSDNVDLPYKFKSDSDGQTTYLNYYFKE